jgi:glycosyltransferase involved in cell wall biosynthesis
MSPRILLVSHQLNRSGAPQALLDLGRAFRALGCHVSMASLNDGPLGDDFQKAGIVPANEADGPFDLCIANTVLTAGVVPDLKSTIPVVVMWIHESPTFYRYYPGLAYSHIPADQVDYILGVADFQVDALRQQFPGIPVRRFDNTFGGGPARAKAAAAGPQTPLKICIVGSPEPRKGCYRLGRMSDLGRPARQVQILLVGIEPDAVAGFMHPSQVPPDVYIQATGKIPHETVMHYLAFSDIYMALSEDDVKPLGVLEALSLQRPVIATDIPAHRELHEEFPHIVCTDGPLDYAWAVAAGQAHLDAGDAAAIARGMARYSWPAFVERAQSLIDLIRQ